MYDFENQADALRVLDNKQSNPWYDNKQTYNPPVKRERKRVEEMTDKELLDLYAMCREEIIELNELKADTRAKYGFLKLLKLHAVQRGLMQPNQTTVGNIALETENNELKEKVKSLCQQLEQLKGKIVNYKAEIKALKGKN